MEDDDSLEMLLSQSQDILAQTNRGSTPLHLACCSSLTAVKLLLSYPEGIQSLAVRDGEGCTPLARACDSNRVDIIEVLLTYPQAVDTISYVDNMGRNCLHYSCCGRTKAFKLLLQHKQGIQAIHTVANNGYTPLHYACRYLSNKMIKYILRYVGSLDRPEFKTLIACCEYDTKEIIWNHRPSQPHK